MTRARSLAVVALLVLAAISGPGVGGAAAATSPGPNADIQVGSGVEGCSVLDNLIYNTYTLGITPIEDDSNPCSAEYQRNKTIQQYEAHEANTTNLTTYNRLTDQQKVWETYTTTQQNYLEDTRTVAMAKAERAAVEAIENGANRSETRTAAREAVSDYYAQKQINLIRTWNTEAEKFQTIYEIQLNQTGSVDSVIGVSRENDTLPPTRRDSNTYHIDIKSSSLVSESVTLANGSQVNAKVVEMRQQYIESPRDGGADYTSLFDVRYSPIQSPATETFVSGEGDYIQDYWFNYGWRANSIGTNPSQNVTTAEWNQTFHEIESQSAQIEDNGAAYGATVYNATTSGDANASSYLSPLALAQEYRVNDSSGGHYSYALSALSGVGWSTPDMDTTGMMTISYNGSTYEGFVASTQTPGQGWQTGQTYYTASINGSELLVTRSNGTMQMQGSFTIDAIEATDGSQVNSTQTVQVRYETINNSEYIALQEQIRNLSAQYEAREPTTGGGTGGSGDTSGGSSMTAAAIGGGLLLVALGGVFLYGRSS